MHEFTVTDTSQQGWILICAAAAIFMSNLDGLLLKFIFAGTTGR
jgi:hypothetical protein